MHAIGKLDANLPRAIPVEELRMMLGSTRAFCSPNASNSTVNELTDRWPFLFSDSFLSADSQKSTQ